MYFLHLPISVLRPKKDRRTQLSLPHSLSTSHTLHMWVLSIPETRLALHCTRSNYIASLLRPQMLLDPHFCGHPLRRNSGWRLTIAAYLLLLLHSFDRPEGQLPGFMGLRRPYHL